MAHLGGTQITNVKGGGDVLGTRNPKHEIRHNLLPKKCWKLQQDIVDHDRSPENIRGLTPKVAKKGDGKGQMKKIDKSVKQASNVL